MRGKTVDPISWTRGISMSIVTMQPPPAAARRPAPNPPGPRPHPSGLADPVMRSQRAQTRQNSVTLSRRQGEQMNDSHIFLPASVYQRKSLKEVRPTLLSLRWESSRPSSSVKECYGTREWEGKYCDRVDASNFAHPYTCSCADGTPRPAGLLSPVIYYSYTGYYWIYPSV